jgi:hypothetical protein
MAGQNFGTWTENTRKPWAAEPMSPDRLVPGGARVDPAQFIASDGVRATLSALAAVGATSLAVTALTGPIPSGSLINFGARAAQTVTVSASALAAATSISVNALTAALPAGTLLDFGTNKFARTTALAAAGATTLAVSAIPTALAGGETATGPASSGLARTTAAAAAGATSITVEALAEPIANASVGTYAGDGNHKKVIPGGTLLGRTITERDAGTAYGVWTSGDDDYGLSAFEIDDADANPDVVLLRSGFMVKENLLPDWTLYDSTKKTALRAKYSVTVGIN